MEFEDNLTPEEVEAKKAEIRDAVENPDDGKELELPSEKNEDTNEDRVYANKFKSVDELKKGIDNLGSELPSYLLEGLSEDALEQHYLELQKEFSSRKVNEKEDETPNVENKPSENISDALWADLEKTYGETGDITDEQRAQLDKAGIPKQVVDKYMNGLEAERQMFTNEVYKIAGGQDEYETIKAWAEENYSQAELDAVASGTNAEILMKYKGVKADYLAANNGTVNTKDRLRGGSSTGTKGYNNQEEYLLDRMSPEWKTAKGRARIEAKFKASSFAV